VAREIAASAESFEDALAKARARAERIADVRWCDGGDVMVVLS
jgi:hypothetical protein